MLADKEVGDMDILNGTICSLERFGDPGWLPTEMLAGELRTIYASVAGAEPMPMAALQT